MDELSKVLEKLGSLHEDAAKGGHGAAGPPCRLILQMGSREAVETALRLAREHKGLWSTVRKIDKWPQKD